MNTFLVGLMLFSTGAAQSEGLKYGYDSILPRYGHVNPSAFWVHNLVDPFIVTSPAANSPRNAAVIRRGNRLLMILEDKAVLNAEALAKNPRSLKGSQALCVGLTLWYLSKKPSADILRSARNVLSVAIDEAPEISSEVSSYLELAYAQVSAGLDQKEGAKALTSVASKWRHKEPEIALIAEWSAAQNYLELKEVEAAKKCFERIVRNYKALAEFRAYQLSVALLGNSDEL